jgi:hypothetical protein
MLDHCRQASSSIANLAAAWHCGAGRLARKAHAAATSGASETPVLPVVKIPGAIVPSGRVPMP